MGALIFLPIVVALGLAGIRWGVETRTSDDEHHPQPSARERTDSMTHPHIAKLLADAQIDEMLATAGRHPLRKLARRHQRQPIKPDTCHPRRTTRQHPPVVDLSTTSNTVSDRDDQSQYVNA
jgi:hypothetical protein